MNNAFENEKEERTLNRLRALYKNTSLNVYFGDLGYSSNLIG